MTFDEAVAGMSKQDVIRLNWCREQNIADYVLLTDGWVIGVCLEDVPRIIITEQRGIFAVGRIEPLENT